MALVGASGCGKSTTVALIERFYDVEAGVVVSTNNNDNLSSFQKQSKMNRCMIALSTPAFVVNLSILEETKHLEEHIRKPYCWNINASKRHKM